jgi:hypothetical protein
MRTGPAWEGTAAEDDSEGHTRGRFVVDSLRWLRNRGAGRVRRSIGEIVRDKGDGHTDDTAAIQSEIYAASSAGGGSVVFSVGRYFTTAIVMRAGASRTRPISCPYDVQKGGTALLSRR